MEEPELDVDDIQGHVLVGFGGVFECLLGVKLVPEALAEARTVLLRWAARVTRARASAQARALRRQGLARLGPAPDADALGLAMSFSAVGLATLGAFAGPDDPQFRTGAGRAAAALLDELDGAGRPVDWCVGADDATTPDVFFVFAAVDPSLPEEACDALVSELGSSATVSYRESGRRLKGDHEHFGFVDGLSQPAPRGTIGGRPLIDRMLPAGDPLAAHHARPGVPLVWPGQFVFGYPTQQPDSAEPGPPSGGGERLLKNGSLLVFRRLRQHVDEFKAAMKDLAAQFTQQGLPASEDAVAAWCVGRWPDGTPVSLSPDQPDLAISGDRIRNNGFLYRSPIPAMTLTAASGAPAPFVGARDDRFGHACPFFAHIRKVNPRDVPVDQGGSGITLRSQMLRRGIPYGEAWQGDGDDADRGLLFLAYQTSIQDQFHRLMTLWVNSNAAPPFAQEVDPLIGVASGPRTLSRRTATFQTFRATTSGRWVRATGAGYFFAPGLLALREIITGHR